MSNLPLSQRILSPTGQGRLLVVVAALLWSTSGFFAKSPWLGDCSGALLAFWRSFFAALVLLPYGRQLWSVRRSFWRLLPMVSFFAAMSYFYLEAMENTTATNAIYLQSTAPIWTLAIGIFFFNEKTVPFDYVMAILIVIGISLILSGQSDVALGTKTLSEATSSSWGLICGLAAGVCYAGVILSLRHLREVPTGPMVLANTAFSTIALSWVLWQGEKLPTTFQFFLLGCFGSLQLSLPYLLFSQGLRRISAHQAAGIVLLEPLLVPVWEWIVWGHRSDYLPPNSWSIAGGGIIFAGLVVRLLKK